MSPVPIVPELLGDLTWLWTHPEATLALVTVVTLFVLGLIWSEKKWPVR